MQGFIERLLLRAELGEEERRAILSVPFRTRTVRKNRDLRSFGQLQPVSSVIVEGAVSRFSQTRDGRRQYVALHLPGDMADLCAMILPDAAFGLQALADTVVHEFKHDDLLALARENRSVFEAFWRDCVADSSLIAQQVVRIGSLDARARLANLLGEIACRLGTSSEKPELEFGFPLTQSHLGEMLGLTGIHVNRMSRALRERDLAVLTKKSVTILDWHGLLHAGEFDPAFLQFGRVAAVLSAPASAPGG